MDTAVEVTAKWERVGPEEAMKFLEENKLNRTLRDRQVRAYSADMKAGKWRKNGETIKVAHNGNLLDGQHRLWAIIESGCTLMFLVVRGLDPEDQATVDTGARRTYADALKLRGEVNYIELATITRSIWQWREDRRPTGQYQSSSTFAQLDDILSEFPWIRETVSDVRALSSLGLPGTISGALLWKFRTIDKEDADYFWKHLISGISLDEGSPILALRKALLDNKAERHTKRNNQWIKAICCKSWNRYRDGEKVTVLVYRTGGKSPETFPEPH